jgi:hypothetical protein
MRRGVTLGVAAAAACCYALLGHPTGVPACGVPGPDYREPPPPAEFLGRLTSLDEIQPTPSGFSPYHESIATFQVVRVFRGSVDPVVSVFTEASRMKVGEIYTVPLYGQGSSLSAGMECGPQPTVGNPGRLMGYAPVGHAAPTAAGWRPWLGWGLLAAGVALALSVGLGRQSRPGWGTRS